jgi:hypothetical protein
MDKVTKLSADMISVARTETIASTQKFSHGYLISQRAAILKQKEEFSAARDKEVAGIDALLAECERLGVTSPK